MCSYQTANDYYRENKDSIDIIRLFDNIQNPEKLKF